MTLLRRIVILAIILEQSLTWSVYIKKSDTCTATCCVQLQEHDENKHLHLRFTKESHLHNHFLVFSLQSFFLWCAVPKESCDHADRAPVKNLHSEFPYLTQLLFKHQLKSNGKIHSMLFSQSTLKFH